MSAEIVVIGSLNMDLVAFAPSLPRAGETVLGSRFFTACGGKGANQAVAAARLGASVSMVGCVGADAFGSELRAGLDTAGVDHTCVTTKPSASGTALITIDDQATNTIVVVPGAGGLLMPSDVDAAHALLAQCKLLVLQLETPLATVLHAAQLANQLGVKVVLNPAPVQALDHELLSLIDILVPNETEASVLSGMEVNSPMSAERAAQALRARGVGSVIITLGAQGCVAASAQGVTHYPAPKVIALDPTAAGDTFVGGLCAALVRGDELAHAIAFAQAAAALSVTRAGAQPSMPSFAETTAFQKTL